MAAGIEIVCTPKLQHRKDMDALTSCLIADRLLHIGLCLLQYFNIPEFQKVIQVYRLNNTMSKSMLLQLTMYW